METWSWSIAGCYLLHTVLCRLSHASCDASTWLGLHTWTSDERVQFHISAFICCFQRSLMAPQLKQQWATMLIYSSPRQLYEMRVDRDEYELPGCLLDRRPGLPRGIRISDKRTMWAWVRCNLQSIPWRSRYDMNNRRRYQGTEKSFSSSSCMQT